MSVKQTFYLDSAAAGETVRAVRHLPDGEARATLVIAHGMVEHIDRYDEFAAYLADRGIFVMAGDHLGHGLTAKDADSLGYFAKNRDDAVLSDLCNIARTAQNDYPDLPHFLLGHSMGSFFTRRLIAEHPDVADGAIIMGTGHQSRALVLAGLTLARLIALFCGERHRSKLIDSLAFGSYNRAFEPARTPRDWLSRDEAKVDEYIADPLCGGLFTLNAYIGMFRTIRLLYSKRRLAKMRPDMPILFISGGSDPVGEAGVGVRRACDSFARAGMSDLELKLYPEARHEILNEINREQVYADILEWLESKM